MNRKLLLDTNILLDAAINERPGFAFALLLFDELQNKKAEGYISASSLKDVYYVLTKYSDEQAARQYISALLNVFNVLPVDLSICKDAIESNEHDFEDGLIRSTAESVPVDFIISRDEKAFVKSSIKRLSAQDYLNLFCDIQEVTL